MSKIRVVINQESRRLHLFDGKAHSSDFKNQRETEINEFIQPIAMENKTGCLITIKPQRDTIRTHAYKYCLTLLCNKLKILNINVHNIQYSYKNYEKVVKNKSNLGVCKMVNGFSELWKSLETLYKSRNEGHEFLDLKLRVTYLSTCYNINLSIINLYFNEILPRHRVIWTKIMNGQQCDMSSVPFMSKVVDYLTIKDSSNLMVVNIPPKCKELADYVEMSHAVYRNLLRIQYKKINDMAMYENRVKENKHKRVSINTEHNSNFVEPIDLIDLEEFYRTNKSSM